MEVERAAVVSMVESRARHGAQRRRADGYVVHVEVHGLWQGCGTIAEPALGKRRRRCVRARDVYAMAERRRPDRSRPDGDQARARSLHGRRNRYRAPSRRNVDAASHHEIGVRHQFRAGACVRQRRHIGVRATQRPGPALARSAAVVDLGRPVQRGVPVPRRARDRHRLRARAVRPNHLSRRTGVRAVHPGRAGGTCLRSDRRRGLAVQSAPRGIENTRQLPDGKRLSRLRA